MSDPLQDALQNELDRWEAAGLRRELVLPEGIDFTSNNYLGLSDHPKLISAAKDALDRYGVGSAAARLLRGNLSIHEQAEAAAAKWVGTEKALLFPSGWQANQAALTTFTSGEDVIFSDALNHASLIDGARLSKASVQIFAHNDLDDLACRLDQHKGARRRLIVVESVYSMDGDLAPLHELLELAAQYDAYLYIDHAHGAGVFGDLYLQSDRILAQMITGGKALGVGAAFICGTQKVIELLVNRGRSFVFTTAVTPSTAAALTAAIKLVQEEPHRATQVRAMASRLREKLHLLGISTPPQTPIVPVMLGSEDRAMAVAQEIRSAGFDIRAIRPPTVPKGTSRLRIVCHADHTDAQIDLLAEAVASAVAKYPGNPNVDLVLDSSQSEGKAVVVCGTDTDVGKTIVSSLLVRSLVRRNIAARYLKPAQTGDDSDTETVESLSRLPSELVVEPVLSLALAASVDQAADHAGVTVHLSDIHKGVVDHLQNTPEAIWVLECAGGLRVPYNANEDQADLLVALNKPIVLVARSGLGTLNHTLLTVEAMEARGLSLSALFLVGDAHPANVKTLHRRLSQTPIYELPRLNHLNTENLDHWLDTNELERLFP